MLSVIALILCFSLSFAKQINVTVSNCTLAGSEGMVQSIKVDPPSPEKMGHNFTVSSIAIVNADITDIDFTVVTSLAGVPIFETGSDACTPFYVRLPPTVSVYYGGVACPLKKGEGLTVPVTIDIGETAPDFLKIDTKVSIYDRKTDKEVICVDVVVEMVPSNE
eukprot:UN00007